MSKRKPIPLALTVPEAAAQLSLSSDSFRRHVLPDLRVIRAGRSVRVLASDLERWAEQHAALDLPGVEL